MTSFVRDPHGRVRMIQNIYPPPTHHQNPELSMVLSDQPEMGQSIALHALPIAGKFCASYWCRRIQLYVLYVLLGILLSWFIQINFSSSSSRPNMTYTAGKQQLSFQSLRNRK